VEHFSQYIDEPVVPRTAGKRKVAVYLGLAVLLAAATLVAVNATGSPARSLSARGADKAGNVVPQAAGCTVTFTNPGPPPLTACVSGHGNVNNLIYSPFGSPVDHMNTEGYCLVDLNAPSTVYWDAGSSGEGGWGVATQSSTATTTTVTRTTTDGIYTLTQNIFFKYGSRLVLIGNLLKNNDSASHTVRFNRYANLDIDGTGGNDVFDAIIGSSEFAQEINGVALTSLGNPALVQAFGAETFASWNATGKSACGHTLQPTPTPPGDFVAIMQHTTTLAPGASVNFRVGYRLL
jgi:hypothetical protein